MKNFKTYLFIFFLSLTSFISQAQNDTFQEWLRDFQSYQTELPTEKVFIHLDKSEYTLGETIWMKSYLVAGAGHIPSPFSKNVYVELLNEDEQIIERLNLRSEEGLSKASLKVDKNLSPGFYYLRAYTNWMKNQETEFFFNKKIKIHSLKVEDALQETEIREKVNLSFFPEGGDMINGLMGRVAFEVSGIKSERLPIKGKVFNSNQEEVATFETMHEGRGLFTLLPSEDQYTAKIDGFDETFPLPQVKSQGVTLTINNEADDFINVKINTSYETGNNYYLVVHTRGYVTYASELRLKSNKGLTRINKSTLPNGVSHITLFNGEMTPLAERLAFVNYGKELKIDISTKDANYNTRDLATIDLKVTDNLGQPVQGSFSMSVFDAKLVQNDQIDYSITANLLLTSDLKGFVKNPSQYLKQDIQARRNADLLMMVNGWRRFNWSDLEFDKREPLYAFEQSLRIKGRLTKPNGKAVSDGRVFLLSNEEEEESKGSRLVLADENGNFQFDNLMFYDTTEIALQGFQNDKVKTFKYQIDGSFEKLPLNRYLSDPVADNPVRLKALKEYAITSIRIDSTYRKEKGIIYLDDVYVTASKREDQYRTLNSQYGKGEAYVNFDKLTYEEKNGRDPFTVMLGKVAGFTLGNASAGSSDLPANALGNTRVSGSVDQSTGGDPMFRVPTLRQGPFIGPPLILIDNVQVPYASVYDLRATEIDYVEIYKSGSAAMFGTNGFNGAIAFYTLKGDKMFNAINSRPGVEVIQADGYHAAREFYAPKYDESNTQQFIPDERSTIYWAPMITTDSEGKAQVQFYTHDRNSNVFIDIQGISNKGLTGTGVSQFTIRKSL